MEKSPSIIDPAQRDSLLSPQSDAEEIHGRIHERIHERNADVRHAMRDAFICSDID